MNGSDLKAYFKMKQDEQKQQAANAKAYQVLQAKKALDKEKSGKDKKSRFRRIAQGIFYKKDDNSEINVIPPKDGVLYEEER